MLLLNQHAFEMQWGLHSAYFLHAASTVTPSVHCLKHGAPSPSSDTYLAQVRRRESAVATDR